MVFSKAKLISFSLVLVVSLYHFSIYSPVKGSVSFFKQAITNISAPLTDVLVQTLEYFSQKKDKLKEINQVYKKNKILENLLLKYEGKIAERDEIYNENLRLKKLLNFNTEQKFQKLLARVSARYSGDKAQFFRCIRGIQDGVKQKSIVVGPNGFLVGKVTSTYQKYSDVLPIISPLSRVDVVISRTRSLGILVGNGLRKSYVDYIDSKDEILIGDKVYTSGHSLIFPKGLYIGIVKDIEKNKKNLIQKLYIDFAIDFKKLEELIILNRVNFE